MVRKVNSLNIASCFLPHVPPGKTTLLLNFCLFPLTYALLGLFFFNSWKKKYHPTNLYLKRNRNDHVEFASVQTFHLCVCACVCVCEAVHSSFYMGWLSFLGLFWSPPSWACAWDQIFLACYDSEHLTWTTSESFSW